MKLKPYFLLSTVFLIPALNSCDSPESKEMPHSVIGSVNPFIGTGGHGHTYPGATMPAGAVQLSPDTRRGNWDACAGYHYSDTTLLGFSHTHLSGTGCIDLGDILVRPLTAQYPIAFTHSAETASPGYYSVNLADEDIRVELTATLHTGIHRYTFGEKAQPTLIFDLNHTLDQETILEQQVRQTAVDEIAGMRRTTGWVPDQPIYFVARFSCPIRKSAIQTEQQDITLRFDREDKTPLVVLVGISLVSEENARQNLLAETSGFDFDVMHAKAKAAWENDLSRIRVAGGTSDQITNFYTALYHSRLMPDQVSDINGEYRRSDNRIESSNRPRYSTLSLWDTFRAWNPLMTLMDTTLVNDMIHSMLDMYEVSGELPLWPLSSGETGTMIGYHSVSVITDAYLKGIRGFDAHKALRAMVASAEKNKKGADYYIRTGYIPSNIKKESVSCLLEFAYDDWCIARLAKELGEQEIYDTFAGRCRNYVNVFDGSTRFFRGRRADGNWETPFDPTESGRAYTEATAYQYRFFAPHDVNGLVQLYGGNDTFVEALDDLFTTTARSDKEMTIDISGLIGQYAHGNEPSHHMAHLYSYVGQPWKTQEMVSRILAEMYQSTPEGISGNEDCGQMSAWYVQNALGFYSVCPGSNEFILTTPMFEQSEILLANGKLLQIRKKGKRSDRYIQRVLLNGKALDTPFITYDQLMGGGELLFEVTDTPCYEWGTTAAPYSFTPGAQVSVPYVSGDLHLFENSVTVELGCATPDARICYTLDGSEPTESAATYEKPLVLTTNRDLRIRAFRTGMTPSPETRIAAIKAELRQPDKISLARNGVRFQYYEGLFSCTGDLNSQKVLQSGVLPEPSIRGARQDDHFGYIYTGYLYAPESGVYELMTRSDDGSVLKIGKETVVDNDGSHAAIAATGRIALAAGYHAFTLLYFEDYEGDSLEWGWRKPSDSSFEKIPAENLFID